MGVLIAVVGPSQAGKNTLINCFLEEYPRARRLVTATSRAPRSGERNGVDKFFITREFFEQNRDAFFETVEEHGNYYGVLKEPLYATLEQYPVVFADIDMRGARTLSSSLSGFSCYAIFVCPDRFEELEQRIHRRGDSNAQARVATAKIEWEYRNDALFSAVVSTSCTIEESYAQFKQAVLSIVGDKIN